MAYNIIVGALIALSIFFAITMPVSYIIEKQYATAENEQKRVRSYVEELQQFANERYMDSDRTDEFNDWIRGEPYVFLLIYGDNHKAVPSSVVYGSTGISVKNKIQEITGSRIDDDIDRSTLIQMAQANGFYEITLVDCTVTVAICEFTEDLYITASHIGAIFLALVAFFASLVNFTRITIERIKRFESDVTIVSEIDMNYEIVSEGADEIAKLSGNVEVMRQRMLENVQSEKEAREANTELIAAISHDIRTPLTVLLGYLEMMKERETDDEVMKSYIDSAESTAFRLKHLSDNMFKYSLAFGDADKNVNLEEYDADMLFEQLLSEHIVLLREKGYDVQMVSHGGITLDGYTVVSDAPNLMRIVDNLFSNIEKYADISYPIIFSRNISDDRLIFECTNRIAKESKKVESNGIGLKNCVRLASLIADKFEYESDGENFVCRLIIPFKSPDENKSSEDGE